MPDTGWWNALWPQPERVIDLLAVAPGLEIVDLCCGDGLFTVPLAARARSVIAVDLDWGLLAVAGQRVAGAGFDNCAFIAADARRLPAILPWRADLVFLANTFHGVPDQTGLARIVQECLKPRGRLVILNWHRRPREETRVLGVPRGPRSDLRMTPDDTAAMVVPAGFINEAVIDLPPYHYGAVFRADA